MRTHVQLLPRGRRRRWRCSIATGLALIVAALGPALAAPADERSAARTDDPAQRRGALLAHDRLRQLVGAELETFSALDRLDRLGALSVDAGFRQALSDDVEHAVRRAGRDRIADQLVDVFQLEARLDRLVGRAHEAPVADSPATARGEGSRWHVGVGLRHALPRLELRRSGSRGDLRLTFATDGRAALRFRGARQERTELDAGYDGDGRFHVSCAIGF